MIDNKVVKNCKAVIESSLQMCTILRTLSLLLRQLAENVAEGEGDEADEKEEEKRP